MDRKKVAATAIVAAVAIAIALAVAALLAAPPSPPPPPPPPGGNGDGGNGNGNGAPPNGGGNNTGGGGGANGTRPVVRVLASPSTFPFMERWVAQYNGDEERLGTAQVDYTGQVDDPVIPAVYSNASDLLARHSAHMVVTGRIFPGTEYGLSSSFVPVSPQAVAIVYNVPGFPDIPSGLRLNSTALAAVLSGNATRWDDPRIAELNPGLNLPGEQITVVHEGRPGAPTELVLRYAGRSDGDGDGSSWAWPETGLAAESAGSLSTLVRQTPYSVGYVDFAYAVQTRMTFAALQNAAGQYVLPSAGSVEEALRNGTGVARGGGVEEEEGGSGENGALPPEVSGASASAGSGSYPVVSFYYAAVRSSDGDRHQAVLDLLQWIAGEQGQQVLADLQYPSIYEHPGAQAYVARSLNQTLGTSATGQ